MSLRSPSLGNQSIGAHKTEVPWILYTGPKKDEPITPFLCYPSRLIFVQLSFMLNCFTVENIILQMISKLQADCILQQMTRHRSLFEELYMEWGLLRNSCVLHHQSTWSKARRWLTAETLTISGKTRPADLTASSHKQPPAYPASAWIDFLSFNISERLRSASCHVLGCA